MFEISEIPAAIRQKVQEGEVIVNPIEQIIHDLGNGWNLIASQRQTFGKDVWADLIVHQERGCIITNGFSIIQFMRSDIHVQYLDGDPGSRNGGWGIKLLNGEDNIFKFEDSLYLGDRSLEEYIATRVPIIFEFAKEVGAPDGFLSTMLDAISELSD